MSLPVIPQILIENIAGRLLETDCDCLVVGVGDEGAMTSAATDIDQQMDGWLTRSIDTGLIKTGYGEMLLLPMPPAMGTLKQAARSLLFVGFGKATQLDRGKAHTLGATILRRLCDVQRDLVVVSLDSLIAVECHDSFIAGSITGCDGQAIYATEPKAFAPTKIAFEGVSDEAIVCGKTIGDSINVVRRLVNEPPNRMYPQRFAEAAQAIAGEVGLGIEVWDEQRLEAEGCRALLAVGAASIQPSRMVILHHTGGADSLPSIALVGKGVTFDSGGLSIKPSEGMIDMKCDMAGAATVLGVMRALAIMKVPVNVIGLCGLAENMISGDAFKLGDVIETRKGTMIEILNTDAEGRVVLADVLDVAVQHRPAAIIDLATLTGACMVALGRDVAGLMTNNEPLCSEIRSAAGGQGELVWQLPMFDFYREQINSKVADIKNVGDGRWGGAITAAKFLEQFVDCVPWVHIDIAGPAFAESAKPHRDAGATGVMLRTLVGWLQSRAAG